MSSDGIPNVTYVSVGRYLDDERVACSNQFRGKAADNLTDKARLVDALVAARAAGTSWQKIGAILGTSAQAAQQRYGAVIEPA